MDDFGDDFIKDYRGKFIRDLDNLIGKIKLMNRDPEVQVRLKELAEQEIDLYSFLLALEFEETPIEKITFREKAETKTKTKEKDCVFNS